MTAGSSTITSPSERALASLPEGWTRHVRETAHKLLTYCLTNDWAGYDPYDALNSRIFQALPFLNFKLARLALTQANKRSPVNLRPLLQIPVTQNPKGLAIFLMALLKLSKLGVLFQPELLRGLIEKLALLRSPGTPYWCWGYSFPWQTRTLLVPRAAPNLVCTTFVANALLDYWMESRDPNCLAMAVSAADYLLKELYWTENDSVASFNYPTPQSRSQVHNANFLAAALLCRVGQASEITRFTEPALRVARSSARRQRTDGSWAYGESPTQQWIDNFHTGYNLCALRGIAKYCGTSEFDDVILRGFAFYRGHFFLEDGAPKYFHDRSYPFDVHSAAQSIITLNEFQDSNAENLNLASLVFKWSMANLWDERGYFYHQKLAFGTIRIPYMRWGQAWMLLALASLSEAAGRQSPERKTPSLTELA